MDFRLSRAARILVTLIAAGTITPAVGAQGTSFEGVVNFAIEGGRSFNYYVGHGKVRVEVTAAGNTVTTILTPATQVIDILMPEQRMYMEMKMPADSLSTKVGNPKLTKTDKTDVVAGHPCQYWHSENDDGGTADVCLASDLGGFLGMRNPMQPGAAPSWQKELAGANRFPLKVVTHKSGQDKTVLEATKVEKKTLDASLFAVPSSFHKMEMSMPMNR